MYNLLPSISMTPDRDTDARHRIPFWWWMTYDALVGLVIALGFMGIRDTALILGVAVLFIAVVIDSAEYAVKSPAGRARIASATSHGDQAVAPTDSDPSGGAA